MSENQTRHDPRLQAAAPGREAFIGTLTTITPPPSLSDRQLETIPPSVWEALPEQPPLASLPGYTLRYRAPAADYQVFLICGGAVVGVFRGIEQISLHSQHSDVRYAVELILAAYAQKPWHAPQRMIGEFGRVALEKAWQLVSRLGKGAQAATAAAARPAAAAPQWTPPPPELRIEMPPPAAPERARSATSAPTAFELPELDGADFGDLAVPAAQAATPVPAPAKSAPSRPAAASPAEVRPVAPPAALPPAPAAQDARAAAVARPNDALAKAARRTQPLTGFQLAARALPPLDASATAAAKTRPEPVATTVVRLHCRSDSGQGFVGVCSICGATEDPADRGARWTSSRTEYMKSADRCYRHPE